MLLYLFGIAATIVATVFISKTARENGRKGWLWALIALAIGLGFQIVLPFVAAVVVVIIYVAKGTSQIELSNKVEGPSELLFFVFWLLSFPLMFLVLRFVANAPEIHAFEADEVPPPPTFT